eukprot:TRINITY_DN1703_c0_g2_i1.p1 TRINITY_DN1703_c0_g2~~TRINITY_DN1703_c0_g2_i1.p1  ORF type:complete len:228 (-),score=-0.94 TRINITY_DN1703_c0_g2_i1:125-808(-)
MGNGAAPVVGLVKRVGKACHRALSASLNSVLRGILNSAGERKIGTAPGCAIETDIGAIVVEEGFQLHALCSQSGGCFGNSATQYVVLIRWQGDRGKNGDDGNNDHHLDQRKTVRWQQRLCVSDGIHGISSIDDFMVAGCWVQWVIVRIAGSYWRMSGVHMTEVQRSFLCCSFLFFGVLKCRIQVLLDQFKWPTAHKPASAPVKLTGTKTKKNLQKQIKTKNRQDRRK